MVNTLTWNPRSLVTLTWYRPVSRAVTLTNRKRPLSENNSLPLVSFLRVMVDGGELMVQQLMVTFCPAWTTVDGKTSTVVFLGEAVVMMSHDQIKSIKEKEAVTELFNQTWYLTWI